MCPARFISLSCTRLQPDRPSSARRPEGVIKILIVENDPDLREIVAFLLRRQGYQVFAAGDVRTALLMWRALAPDLILTELRLPDQSGWELCERVLAETGTPVVILSLADADGDRERAYNLGVADYISKPFSTAALMERIAALLDELAARAYP